MNKLNSIILGLHNYYKIATHVNLSFNRIAFLENKTLNNRLKSNLNKQGYISKMAGQQYRCAITKVDIKIDQLKCINQTPKE